MSKLRQDLADTEERLAAALASPRRAARAANPGRRLADRAANPSSDGSLVADSEPRDGTFWRAVRRTSSAASVRGAERVALPDSPSTEYDAFQERAERAEVQADRLRMRAIGAERELAAMRAKVRAAIAAG